MTIKEAAAIIGGPEDGAPVRGQIRAWLLVAVLMLFYVFAVMDRTVIAMLVDPIRADLGINDTQIALLMGVAYAASYAGFALPMGYLVDKLPRKWLLYGAVSLWGVAEAACGVATGFTGLFLARMGVGAFESPLNPAAHSLITDSFSKRRLATALSIYSTGALLGTGVALSVGGWIVNSLLHVDTVTIPVFGAVKAWQLVFILTGLPGLVLGLLIVPFREPQRTSQKGVGEGSWADLWRFLRRNWQLATCMVFAFGGMNIVNGAMIKWQPSYLGRYFHLNPAQYGARLGLIYAVAGVLGLVFMGWLVDKMFSRGRKTAHFDAFGGVLLVTTPFVLYGLFSPNLNIYLASVAVAKGLMVNFLGYFSALIQLISPPRLRGRMAALFLLMVMALLGTSLGPLIPALISDYILHDEIRMGRAIAGTVMIFVPMALIAIVIGRRYVVRAINDAETWTY